jgi:transketolase
MTDTWSTTLTDMQMDHLAVNTIRTLSIDAVQATNSGPPATRMAAVAHS